MNPRATLFKSKVIMVEARRVDAQDWSQVEEIAAWADADLIPLEEFLQRKDGIVMWLADDDDWFPALDGEWVLRTPWGMTVATDEDFGSQYEPAMQL